MTMHDYTARVTQAFSHQHNIPIMLLPTWSSSLKPLEYFLGSTAQGVEADLASLSLSKKIFAMPDRHPGLMMLEAAVNCLVPPLPSRCQTIIAQEGP